MSVILSSWIPWRRDIAGFQAAADAAMETATSTECVVSMTRMKLAIIEPEAAPSVLHDMTTAAGGRSEAAHPGTPPDVETILQVGLIGHRSLSSENIGALQEAGRRVLAEIRAAAYAAPGERLRGSVRLRCVCALAEGADLLLAEEAVIEGFALTAPLPFGREEYRKDFLDDAVGIWHDRLLASAETVFELDGGRVGAEAYRGVGRLLLEQSDVIVAIWDGQPEKGPGGTGEILHEAWLADVPTIIIGSEAPHTVQVHDPAIGDAVAGIQSLVSRIISYRPPLNGPDGLAIYLREKVGNPWTWALLKGGPNAPKSTDRRTAHPEPRSKSDPDREGTWSAARATTEAVLQPHFIAADSLAITYGTLYRISGTLRYLCALPSTIGALMAFYGPPWMSRPGYLIILVALGGTLAIYAVDRKAQWHRRFLDYRFMAEHLRSSKIMALFGSTSALPRLPAHLAAGESDWIAFHLRAIVRSLGLVNARLDAAYLDAARASVLEEMRSQSAFYEARSRRFDGLSKMLQRLGMAFYGVGLVCTIIRYSMAVAGYAGSAYDLMAELALALPSVVPIFLGLRSQAEYNRLTQRYASMAGQLRRTQAALGSDDVRRNRVERMAREMVQVLLGEVSDWRILIKARDLSPF